MTRLIGVKVLGLSMGMSHTLLIAANDTAELKEKLEAMPRFEP